MALINTLTILATVDTTGMVKGLQKGADAVNNFGKQVQSTANTLKAVGAAFAGAWLTGKAIDTIKGGMEAINGVRKEAEKLGASSQNLSEFAYAAQLADVETEAMYGSMEKLNKNLADVAATGKGPAKDALDQMGLSAKELTGMDIVEATQKILVGLNQIENPAARARAAVELFGKSGQAMLNMAAQGAEGLEALRQEARDIGVAFTDIDAAKIDAADDALTRMGAALGGIANQLAIEISPYIKIVTDEMMDLGKQGTDSGNFIKNAFLGVETAIGFVLDALQAVKVLLKASEAQATSWSASLIDGLAWGAEKVDAALGKLGLEKAKGPSFIEFLQNWGENQRIRTEELGKAINKELIGPSWGEMFTRNLADAKANFERQAAEDAKKTEALRGKGEGIKQEPAKGKDITSNKAIQLGSSEFANFVLRSRFGGAGDATREIANNTKATAANGAEQVRLLNQIATNLTLGTSLNIITSI